MTSQILTILPTDLLACPQCGAVNTPAENCQNRFDECLAREFSDPEYGAVHHLTVPAYMLQHSSKLSKQGWLSTRQLLMDFLINNKSPQEIRTQNRNVLDSGKRKWKFTSQNNLCLIDPAIWTASILSVRLMDSKTYYTDITNWAQAVLRDSENVSE